MEYIFVQYDCSDIVLFAEGPSYNIYGQAQQITTYEPCIITEATLKQHNFTKQSLYFCVYCNAYKTFSATSMLGV